MTLGVANQIANNPYGGTPDDGENISTKLFYFFKPLTLNLYFFDEQMWRVIIGVSCVCVYLCMSVHARHACTCLSDVCSRLNEYLFQNIFALYVSCGCTGSEVALSWQPWAGRMIFGHMYASYQQDVVAKSSDQRFKMWLLSLHFFLFSFVSFSSDFIQMRQNCRLDCSFTSCCEAHSCL